jgi:chromosome segregation ATPase
MTLSLEDLYFIVSIIIIIGSAICTIIYFIWNTSKKFTTLQLEKEQLLAQYERDLASIEKKHLNDVQALSNEIQRQTIERRDDMTQESLQRKDDLNNIQKQIESLKADVKGLLSKIEVNVAAIETSKEVHDELCQEDEKNVKFFTDWNQRIEDRIEALRKEYLHMLTVFHGPETKT